MDARRLHFADLDQHTRLLMEDEWNHDLDAGTLYVPPFLKKDAHRQWVASFEHIIREGFPYDGEIFGLTRLVQSGSLTALMVDSDWPMGYFIRHQVSSAESEDEEDDEYWDIVREEITPVPFGDEKDPWNNPFAVFDEPSTPPFSREKEHRKNPFEEDDVPSTPPFSREKDPPDDGVWRPFSMRLSEERMVEAIVEHLFAKYYCRAVAKRALLEGMDVVEIYRGREPKNPRPSSSRKVGRLIYASALLADLRASTTVAPPALGVPGGLFSSLLVRLVER